VVLINLGLFALLFSVVEIGFRVATDSQESSQYQVIELFRRSRADGPGDRRNVDTSLTSDGLRVTTDQPENFSGRVLIFGGSTTFCGEVENRETYPSLLQQTLNASGLNLKVINFGKSAATATDRVEILRGIGDLNPNDIVVFYVGVNEAGVGFAQRDAPVRLVSKFPKIGTALQRASKYSRVADVLFRVMVFGGVSVSSESKDLAVDRFDRALKDASDIASKAGAKFVPVLQANLYTRNPMSDYDAKLGKMYGPALGPIVKEIYGRMLPIVSAYPFGGDATGVMNDLERSPYYDWHHVDVSGNEKISEFIYELLRDENILR